MGNLSLISIGKIVEVTNNNKEIRMELLTEVLNNKEQLEEWSNTFGIDIRDQLPLLEGHPTLPIDTIFYDESFVDKLLSQFDDLDGQIDGLLFHSENYQALELLKEKYKRKINCIYIDPPYNTGSDGFLYKDSFRHSSWLSMMYDRLQLCREIAKKNSSIAVSINEEELFNLKLLLDKTMESDNYLTTITVKVRHDDRILTGDKDIHEVTEQLLVYRNSDDFSPIRRIVDNTSIEDYKWNVTELVKSEKTLELGNKSVTLFSPQEYSLKSVKPSKANLKKESIRGSIKKGNSSGRFYTTHLEPRTDEYNGYLFKVPDMGGDGLGYRYFCIPSKDEKSKNGFYFQGIPIDRSDTKEHPYPNHWISEEGFWDFTAAFNTVGAEGFISFPNGKKPLSFITKYLEISGVKKNASSICLDFFAGSGSTGHAVLNLNKVDNGNRKFILVEMGDFFLNSLKKRLYMAMFSNNWKGDKPDKKRIDGTVGIIKYQLLEQYEDVLNNLSDTTPTESIDTDIPVEYWYRNEEQEIRLLLDLRSPFSNRIIYGGV